MSKISTFITRGDNIESVHGIKCIVLNKKKEILLSTNNNKDLIFPRSSIKIFQALPFILSGASKKYNLNSRQVALACSSHTGENFHLADLKIHIDHHHVRDIIIDPDLIHMADIK